MSKLVPLSVLAFAAAPLQAAPAQDVFTQLAQPLQVVPANVEARAAAMPALALLPQKTDGVLVIPHFGERLQALAKCSPAVYSIGCLAVSAGEGSADTLRAFFSVIMHAQTVDMVDTLKDIWTSSAKPEYAELISNVLNDDMESRAAKFKGYLAKAPIAPIYVSLSAAPGREADFETAYQAILSNIEKKKESEDGAKAVDWQGFKGVELPRKSVLKPLIMPELRNDSEMSQFLEKGSVYLLVKKQDNNILLIVCSDMSAISLPTSPASSLLASPALNSVDAHLNGQDLVGTMWLAPAIQQHYIELSRSESYASLADLIATVFDKLATADAANASAFKSASAGVRNLTNVCFPSLPNVQVPFSLTAWMSGNDVCIQNTYDAMGLKYEQGELRTVSFADAPETVLYAESTAFEAKFTGRLNGDLSTTCLDVAKGFTLTTEEDVQDQISQKLQLAAMFNPDLIALGDAVNTVFSGLTAPCSLVITEAPAGPAVTQPSGSDVKPMPGIALYAGVKDRSALAAGWLKIAGVAQQVSDKLGGPQNIISMLPVMPRALNGSAVNYALMLPIPSLKLEPQLTVSDKSFVLSTNTVLGDKVLSLVESSAVPFRGFAAKLKFSTLAHVVQALTQEPTPLNEVQKRVSGITVVSTDYDGAIISQYRVHLNQYSAPTEISVKMNIEVKDESSEEECLDEEVELDVEEEE